MRTSYIFISTLFCFLLSNNLSAQQLPCAPKVKGLHFSAPIYHYSPALYSNMPLDIMASYIIADSLLRYADKPAVLDFLDRVADGTISPSNDTLNYAYKYLYKLMDYDPLLFWNFIMNVGSRDNLRALYLYEILSTNCEKYGINGGVKQRLLRTYYVLHIDVESTSLFIESTEPNALIKDMTVVYANVLDTIKGKVLPDLNTMLIGQGLYPVLPANAESQKEMQSINSNNYNLVFDYSSQWNLNGDGEMYHADENGRTGALVCEDGSSWIKSHKEYIVFLTPAYECKHDGRWYFALWHVGGFHSHGMYPIESGNVLDVGNVFGWGKSVSVAEFKAKLNAVIDEMQHYGE